MKASVLFRTGSVPVHLSLPSPKVLARSRSFILSPRSASPAEPKAEMRIGEDPFRRVRSDTDLIGSSRITTRPLIPATLTKKEEEKEEEVAPQYSGGGIGTGKRCGSGGDRSENERMSEYYKRMLSADPENPLLLQNYGRFLHEVEGDARGAEECYGRAVLASPGNGEVLAMYGKLLWETHRDEERAGSYFERAVESAPDDCYVLGSYAHFLWDADEEAEDAGKVGASGSALVEAF